MKTILGFFSLLILFTNCTNSRYAYSPTAHNVPLFTKQGDSKIAANYSNNGANGTFSDNSNQYEKSSAQGFDLQGAVAVTNNIALQTSYSYRNERSSTSNSSGYDFTSSSVRYNRYFFEFGAGYFMPVDKKQRMLFQVYAGAGLGKTMIKDNGIDYNQALYSRYYNTNITKFYIEPSLTFRAKDIFAATISTRASIVKFHNVSTDYTLTEKQDFNLDSLNRYAVAFFEPAFIGSFGFHKLPGFRIEFQVGLSALWQDDFIDYRPFNFSAGLVFDIGKMIKGVQEKSKD